MGREIKILQFDDELKFKGLFVFKRVTPTTMTTTMMRMKITTMMIMMMMRRRN